MQRLRPLYHDGCRKRKEEQGNEGLDNEESIVEIDLLIPYYLINVSETPQDLFIPYY